MIANFFNKTKPITTLSLIVLLGVYYISAVFLKESYSLSTFLFIKKLVFFLCLILLLLIFNFIIQKNKLSSDNSYALLLVVLLLGTFYKSFLSNVVIFTNIGLLLSYRKIYSLRSGVNTKMKVFDAAFWIGISTLIYSWSILYLLLIYIGLLIYEKVSVKNLLIPIVGFVTPIIIFFTYHLYFESLAVFYNCFNFEVNLDFGAYYSLKFLAPILFLIIILGWAIVSVTPRIVLISNKLKLAWNVVLNHLLISIVIVVLSSTKNGSEMFYLVFPSVIIIANFIQKTQSLFFKNLLLYLFLIISIVVYFL